MSKDKYVSKKNFVSGFSFANLGVFSGFGNAVISAVYSLVLLDIFHNSATVGIYVSIYSAFCMIITLFAGEFFRLASKAKLLYICMISMAVMYFMMAFSIKPMSFIALDYASAIPQVLIGLLIPLFMADFSHNVGMSKLNGRYYLWLNVGALSAPIVAMRLAESFGNRSAFFATAIMYMVGFFYFKYMGIIQEDKKIKKISPRKTIKSLWNNTVSFFKNKSLSRAYAVSFGSLFLSAMRGLYVPIIVIEQGFSKDTLGLILTLGVIPYVLLSEVMGRLARKYGTKLWMAIGFLSFSALAFWASFASGITLLVIFVLWQIPGAFMEPLRDLLFFDTAKKSEQSKYIGIFKTAGNMTRFIAPLIGAGFIMFFGATSYVWIITGIIAILSTFVLLAKPKA